MERVAGCADLERIRGLIKGKEKDYSRYKFSRGQNSLQRIFSDLAQDLESIQDFYKLCVVAPGEYLGVNCALYLLDHDTDALCLACDFSDGVLVTDDSVSVPDYLHSAEEPYEVEGVTVFPVCFPPYNGQDVELTTEVEVLGLFVVKMAGLAGTDLFFLGKYVNRVAVNLHNRLLALQNIQHLKFINGLVMDIEHNIIVPNMYFRHLFNNLKKSVVEVAAIKEAVDEFKAGSGVSDSDCEKILKRISLLHQQLDKQHQELQEHHSTTSLFLESLFRRDHFVQGHLVLQSRYCRVEEEIIAPQLEHFSARFAARGITIEPPADMGGEKLLLVVDVGLLSQVYANLFSNALKYVEEIVDHRGHTRKAMTYGREFVADFFGPARHGVKLNVFTTGRHLDQETASRVFNEGYRGELLKEQPGSGHGLAFVKQVIDIHGGVVGYESTEEGNNFYFVLPRPVSESALSVIVGPPQLP